MNVVTAFIFYIIGGLSWEFICGKRSTQPQPQPQPQPDKAFQLATLAASIYEREIGNYASAIVQADSLLRAADAFLNDPIHFEWAQERELAKEKA